MNHAKDNSDLQLKILKFYLEKESECVKSYEKCKKIDGNMYEDIENDKYESFLLKTSIVILTANQYEKQILHYNSYNCNKQKIGKIQISLLNNGKERLNCNPIAYFLKIKDYYILNIHADVTGSYTIGGSGDIVRYIINNIYLNPTVIISFGICFGTDENKCNLGDVVISRKIYPYFIGAKLSEKELEIRDENWFSTEPSLASMINNNVIGLNLLGEISNFRIYFDNFITGEAVISNRIARKKFKEAATNQRIIAGDMEGYGLYKECFMNCYSNISCLVVKGICDWGINKNIDQKIINTFLEAKKKNPIDSDIIKDRLQTYAADNAYKLLIKLIESEIFKKNIYEEFKKTLFEKDETQIFGETIKRKYEKILEKRKILLTDFHKNNLFVKIIKVLLERKIIKSTKKIPVKFENDSIMSIIFEKGSCYSEKDI